MKNKTLGFTLTETLVAIVIGMISVAAAFSAYNYFNKSYASISQKASISKSAREALTAIARDLRNAGYIDPNYVAYSPESNRTERTVRMNMLSVSQKDLVVSMVNQIIFNFGMLIRLRKVDISLII